MGEGYAAIQRGGRAAFSGGGGGGLGCLITHSAGSFTTQNRVNVWQTCHDLFKMLGVSVWFRSHHIFECFPLGGNSASIMSHQTAPPPPGSSPPFLYGSITFTHLEENFNMVKLPCLCEKAKGKPVWLRNHHM
jgi:hypothetical protein